jgi:hypothetical protein
MTTSVRGSQGAAHAWYNHGYAGRKYAVAVAGDGHTRIANDGHGLAIAGGQQALSAAPRKVRAAPSHTCDERVNTDTHLLLWTKM